MRVFRVKAFILFSIVFLTLSGLGDEKGKEETGSEQKWDIRDLDATQIKLEDVILLDSDSKFPRWSPDGSKILYTKYGSSIWIVNPDGSNKERIIDGYNAAWSPDGKRIAYKKKEVDKRKIAIFDIVEKKEYIIYEDKKGYSEPLFINRDPQHLTYYHHYHTYWTKDGNKLFFFTDDDFRILNLDDLSWDSGGFYNMVWDGRNIKHVKNKYYRLKTEVNKNLSHPRFIIIDRGGIGIYAKNKEGEIPFEICLLSDPLRLPKLSPDFTKIVFVKPKWKEPLSWDLYVDAMFKGKKPMEKPGAILIAKLGKSPTSHVKYYEIPMGLKNGINRGDKLGIYVPKINPLNNKILGYLGRKGTVLVESVTENKALARTYTIDKDFGQNDIAVKGTSFGYIKEISMAGKKELFYIQVGTFNNREAAFAFAREFVKKGYPAIVLDPFPSDRREIFRVRIGGYATREEAQEVRTKLHSETSRATDYFIIRS